MSKSLVPAKKKDPDGNRSFQERLREKLAKNRSADSGSSSGPGSIPPSPNVCLLLDVSGSMRDTVGGASSFTRKIDSLRELAKDFADIRRFQFSDTCEEMQPQEVISEPRGGTGMDVAFKDIAKAGVTHCVLITDGLPNDPIRTIEWAKKLNLKIDCFYVGPDPAPDFLKLLSNSTGGSYGKATLADRRQLTTSIRGLLPAPSKAIQL